MFNKIIILDCCFAGGFAGLAFRNEEVNLKNGITVLASSRANESSLDNNGHGLFTRLLIDSLNGEASDILGNITPASIYSHIDKSLAFLDQRPLYFANNSRFISLRKIKPAVSFQDIQSILKLFKDSDRKKLDPSYEPTPDKLNHEYPPNPDHTKQFAIMQRLNRVNLVVPISRAHMFDEAMNFGGCKLTRSGIYYKKLLIANLM